MGFLDIVKNLFGKKEPQPTSPSENQNQQTQAGGDGQFMNPQNPVGNQNEPQPSQPSEK